MGNDNRSYEDGYSQAQFEQSLQDLPHDGITGFKTIPIGCGYLYLMFMGVVWTVYTLYSLFTTDGVVQFLKALPGLGMSAVFGIAFTLVVHTLYWNYRRKMMRLYGTSERSQRERERYAREQERRRG